MMKLRQNISTNVTRVAVEECGHEAKLSIKPLHIEVIASYVRIAILKNA